MLKILNQKPLLLLPTPITILPNFSTIKTNSQSYYQVLGLPRTASVLEIKKKYYELAKIYHPDVCKQVGVNSHSKFNQITLAYQVLVDQGKKKEYDREHPEVKVDTNQEGSDRYKGFSARYRSHKQKQAKNEEDEDPFPAYDQYFKNNRAYAKPKRGGDININLTIKLQQSIVGVKKQVIYTQNQLCNSCSQTQKPQCYTCGGKGTIFNRLHRQKQPCQTCSSKGYTNSCQVCSGSSFTPTDTTHQLYIPKNTHNKTILRMEGLGHHGYRSSNGDLYVTVFVEESEEFRIDGNNVWSQCQVDFVIAALGGTIKIKTVYGVHQTKIQPGTQSGQELRIFNMGLTSPYSKRRGDHIIKFKIKVPSALTEKQKELLAQLNL